MTRCYEQRMTPRARKGFCCWWRQIKLMQLSVVRYFGWSFTCRTAQELAAGNIGGTVLYPSCTGTRWIWHSTLPYSYSLIAHDMRYRTRTRTSSAYVLFFSNIGHPGVGHHAISSRWMRDAAIPRKGCKYMYALKIHIERQCLSSRWMRDAIPMRVIIYSHGRHPRHPAGVV